MREQQEGMKNKRKQWIEQSGRKECKIVRKREKQIETKQNKINNDKKWEGE